MIEIMGNTLSLVISFFIRLHPSRSTITGICVDPGDTAVFCDAYFEHTGLEFYVFPQGGEVAGGMRYRERFLERKACVDLADIRRKKGLYARGRFVPFSVPRTPFG